MMNPYCNARCAICSVDQRRGAQLDTLHGAQLSAEQSSDGKVKLIAPQSSGWIYEADVEGCKVSRHWRK